MIYPKKRLRDIGRIAARYCDFALFVGDHAHYAARAAIGDGMDVDRCRAFILLEDAASWLRGFLRDGDLVFLKGRTSDHLSRILFAQFGTIGCWKTSCRIRRPCDVCSQLRCEFDLDGALRGSGS